MKTTPTSPTDKTFSHPSRRYNNGKFRGKFLWLLKAIITLGILYHLFLKIPITQVVAALLDTKISYLIFGFLLQICMRYINAVQLRVFLRQQKINFSTVELMKINLVVLFYGLVLPGELSGGIVKWHKLSRRNKMRAQAAACIVLSRTVNLLSLAILGISCFLLENPYNSSTIAASLLAGLTFSLGLYLCITNAKAASIIERLFGKLSFFPLPTLLKEKIAKLWESIKHFHQIPLHKLNYTLLLATMYQLAGITSVELLMLAAGIKIPLISVIWIRAAVIFLQMLPVSISGLGVREGAFVFLLKKYAVSAADAMALSFTIFGITVILALIGGTLEATETLLGKSGKTDEHFME